MIKSIDTSDFEEGGRKLRIASGHCYSCPSNEGLQKNLTMSTKDCKNNVPITRNSSFCYCVKSILNTIEPPCEDFRIPFIRNNLTRYFKPLNIPIMFFENIFTQIQIIYKNKIKFKLHQDKWKEEVFVDDHQKTYRKLRPLLLYCLDVCLAIAVNRSSPVAFPKYDFNLRSEEWNLKSEMQQVHLIKNINLDTNFSHKTPSLQQHFLENWFAMYFFFLPNRNLGPYTIYFNEWFVQA